MKITPTVCSLFAAAAICGAWASTGPAAAAAAPLLPVTTPSSVAPDSITVTVTGKHVAAASDLIVRAKLRAFGATGMEATEAFNQTLTRSLAALGDTTLEGVTIHPGGCSSTYGTEEKEGDDDPMSRMVIMGGTTPDKDEEGLNLSQAIELRVPAAADAEAQRAQLAELVDVSVELGLSFPKVSNSYRSISRSGVFSTDDSNAMVHGELDAEATVAGELAAQTEAMERARRQAAQLAQLGERQLGKVISINQRGLQSSWKGIGKGTEFACELMVTFEVQ